MANIPICPHCKATRFAVSEQEPDGAAYKLIFVFCIGCGAPFGVTEYLNSGALAEKQQMGLAVISEALNDVSRRVKRIEQAMTSRR